MAYNKAKRPYWLSLKKRRDFRGENEIVWIEVDGVQFRIIFEPATVLNGCRSASSTCGFCDNGSTIHLDLLNHNRQKTGREKKQEKGQHMKLKKDGGGQNQMKVIY